MNQEMFICTVTATTKTCGEHPFEKLWNLSKINKHIDEMELRFYIKSRIKLTVGRNSRAHGTLMLLPECFSLRRIKSFQFFGKVCVLRSIEYSSYINTHTCTNIRMTSLISTRGCWFLLGPHSLFRQEIRSRDKRMCGYLICSACDNLIAR